MVLPTLFVNSGCDVPILGSIRSLRDSVEGPSLLHSILQDAVEFLNSSNGVNI